MSSSPSTPGYRMATAAGTSSMAARTARPCLVHSVSTSLLVRMFPRRWWSLISRLVARAFVSLSAGVSSTFSGSSSARRPSSGAPFARAGFVSPLCRAFGGPLATLGEVVARPPLSCPLLEHGHSGRGPSLDCARADPERFR